MVLWVGPRCDVYAGPDDHREGDKGDQVGPALEAAYAPRRAGAVLWDTLCYGAHTFRLDRSMVQSLRATGTSRKRASPLPALLLDQGSLLGQLPCPKAGILRRRSGGWKGGR